MTTSKWRTLAVGGGSVLALAAAAAALAVGGGPSSNTLQAGTITVGYGNNLTGFLAVHDKLISDGARLAVDQINAKGGIGGKVRIRLILQDVKSDPGVSVSVANDLIAKKVQALVLPCNTDFQVAMAAVAQRRNTFTLSPCNADPKAPRQFGVYWPVGMAGNAQGAQLADYARSKGYKRAYVLDSRAQLYVHLMANYFKKAAPGRGIRIVGEDNIPFGARGFPEEYSAQVTKIKNAGTKPDVIMTGLFTPFVIELIKELRAQGLRTPVIGTDGMDTGLMLKSARTVAGTTFTTFGYPTRGSATATFYADYKRKFGKQPDGSFAALGFEAVKVLEAAVKKANSTNPAKIRAALASGMTVRGALGSIRYLGKGQKNPVTDVAVVTVRNNKFALVKKGVPTKVPAP